MLRKKPASRKKPAPADPSQANPMRAYQRAFCEWTAARGLAPATAHHREWTLDLFIRHLYLLRKADGDALALSTQVARLAPVVAFFKWATREGHILSNPAADLEMPPRRHQLPKQLLSVAQVEQAINQPDVATLTGLRDRAMLETLYSSGIRRGELIALQLHELDTERGQLLVRNGKGRKDRMVPLGERACAWVHRYLAEVRPELLAGQTLTAFLTDWGAPFDRST